MKGEDGKDVVFLLGGFFSLVPFLSSSGLPWLFFSPGTLLVKDSGRIPVAYQLINQQHSTAAAAAEGKENKAGGTAGDRAASREKSPAAGTKQEPASLASPASWRLQVRFGRGRIASAGMDEHRPGHPGQDLPARPRPECRPLLAGGATERLAPLRASGPL